MESSRELTQLARCYMSIAIYDLLAACGIFDLSCQVLRSDYVHCVLSEGK